MELPHLSSSKPVEQLLQLISSSCLEAFRTVEMYTEIFCMILNREKNWYLYYMQLLLQDISDYKYDHKNNENSNFGNWKIKSRIFLSVEDYIKWKERERNT